MVIDAAAALVEAGVITSEDFRSNQAVARSAYLGVKGCGPVTWAYLGILSEVDGIKPDTWLKRFVHDRIPNASQDEVTALLSAVAQRMNIEARRLDHAVWAYRRRTQSAIDS